MKAYQAGIANFEKEGAQVLAISTDFNPSLGEFKKQTGANFPMLSDHNRKVSEQYGVLIPDMGIANRVTFVVDADGKIADIEEGKSALDPMGAETACKRVKKG